MIWPDRKKWAICLTHDVDRIEKKIWHSIIRAVREKNKRYHLKTAFLKGRNNPYWNFEKIMSIENKYGVRSTFFILNEKSKVPIHIKDLKYIPMFFGRYNIREIADVIKKLDEEGWEIGVHGSFYSYENENLLKEEKRRLESIVGHKVIGIRQHNLNLKIPQTWKLQKTAGFKYDATFGSNYQIGFYKNKMYPFRPFNDEFLVIPLTIMDSQLFKIFPTIKSAQNAVIKIFNQAEKYGALVTVLWHQRVFNENEFPGWSKMYEWIIQEGIKRKAWVARCVDVYEVIREWD